MLQNKPLRELKVQELLRIALLEEFNLYFENKRSGIVYLKNISKPFKKSLSNLALKNKNLII
ncbi:hypothetical protein NZ698_10240 [Chryseobacterium sp. PBS4-4]|uniref:Uncharacterized protein n=1 Tax=Chryseobacterium edaphi TaxID=2976532 RepID=A0ABT2W5V0_9FLAO|nr:hypothetical protein [Chryseobacterium edaphi]MCU7617577.1 hypothetical protein [Chryseobacterium edaphi]